MDMQGYASGRPRLSRRRNAILPGWDDSVAESIGVALQAPAPAVIMSLVTGVAGVVGIIGREVVAGPAGDAVMPAGADVEPGVVVRAAPIDRTRGNARSPDPPGGGPRPGRRRKSRSWQSRHSLGGHVDLPGDLVAVAGRAVDGLVGSPGREDLDSVREGRRDPGRCSWQRSHCVPEGSQVGILVAVDAARRQGVESPSSWHPEQARSAWRPVKERRCRGGRSAPGPNATPRGSRCTSAGELPLVRVGMTGRARGGRAGDRSPPCDTARSRRGHARHPAGTRPGRDRRSRASTRPARGRPRSPCGPGETPTIPPRRRPANRPGWRGRWDAFPERAAAAYRVAELAAVRIGVAGRAGDVQIRMPCGRTPSVTAPARRHRRGALEQGETASSRGGSGSRAQAAGP